MKIQLVENIKSQILNPIIGLLFTAALIYFILGLVQFLGNPSDFTKKNEGRNHMLWGLVGMAVMFSAWSLIWFAAGTMGSLFE